MYIYIYIYIYILFLSVSYNLSQGSHVTTFLPVLVVTCLVTSPSVCPLDSCVIDRFYLCTYTDFVI